MAQRVRQTKLFAAEDYMAVYDSYLNANFQAFDFDTIRASMVDYIREQYPESFNDWVESSDFVALLDVIAQFGHNLAFRADLNARNNFLATAQRQDSVFKLAEFLGYRPRRNVPASGELKITSVKTTEPVIGSEGTTLANKELRFEATNNANNLDDFIAVMNAVFLTNNQFGNPRRQALVNGVTTQFYGLNNNSGQIVFEMSGVVQAKKEPFNLIGTTYNQSRRIIQEEAPNPNKSFSIMYKNDGKGVSSANTGFFMGFRQGSLAFKDFNIETPISSLTLDVNTNNINQEDVWVQTIDTDGSVITQWTAVDNVHSFNEIYNNIDGSTRTIFSVKSRTDGQVSVIFPDESFGELPKGLIRVWYRPGVNKTYVLRPDDIGKKNVNIKYVGQDGNQYTATFGVQLKATITNASARESLDDIRENAPRVYAAQDRMITASDYNNYLLTKSDQIAKIKSVNRTHSGHSRFVTPMDPTGQYSNVRLFATDGYLTVEESRVEKNTNNLNPAIVFDRYIRNELENDELVNLYYHKFRNSFELLNDQVENYYWQTNDSISGYFIDQDYNITGNTGSEDSDFLKYVQPGAMLQFINNSTNETYWARVLRVFANGLGVDDSNGSPSGLTADGHGAISLDTQLPSNIQLVKIYPAFARKFTASERADIISMLSDSDSFIIKFNYEDGVWETKTVIDAGNPQPEDAFPENFDLTDDSWLIYVAKSTATNSFDITTRVIKFSINTQQIEFSNISNEYRLDYYTKKSRRDQILIDNTNKFYISGYKVDENGVYDSSTVHLCLIDNNGDDRPDNPDSFVDLTGGETEISDLRYEWTHIPANNEIIDPSFSNIIDVFTLTRSYDTFFRSWLISNDNEFAEIPLPPTLDELNQQFGSILDKKAMSDSVIYRPVKYRVLFGNKAPNELRASFSVVKSTGSSLTTNEIKSRIVDAIYEFFDISLWDFGESFYFTELAAYVHQQLAGNISSFVIVPESANSVFGKLFQITPQSDELFVPDVSIGDIEMVDYITKENIKAIG